MKRLIRNIFAAILTLAFFSVECCAADWISGDIYRGSGEKTVALTFDDGPDETKTDIILEILKRYGVKATFFMIGKNAELYPEIVSRVIANGHEIGNHTYSHVFLSGMSVCEVRSEFSRGANAIFSVSECEAHFLRPPGGIYDENVISAAKADSQIIALWSIDTLDWCHRSKNEIVTEVLENIRGGDIVLMHDYICGESHTAEALETIIPTLKERGYEFVTLSDMYLNHRN